MLTKYQTMIGRTFSKRERTILKECCRQVIGSINKEELKKFLTPEVVEIREDLEKIMKKLEPTL